MTNWSRVTLGDVCELKYGRSLPASVRRAGDVPVFGSNGRVGSHDEALTSGPSVVVGRKGSLGEVAYSESPCWPIDTTYYIDETATSADLRWLAYRLDGMGLTELNRAAAVPGLNRDDAYREELLLPPVEEQRRIAGILDRADALRAKRHEAATMIEALQSSIYFEMFESQGAGFEWPTEPLEDVVRTGTLVTYGIVQAGDEFPGGVPYIRTGDIQDGRILADQLRRTAPEIAQRFARSRVDADDVVMSIRATVGTTAVVPAALAGANLTQGTARISPGDRTLPPFLLQQLRSDTVQRWIRAQVKGATFREITLGRLRRLPIALPPMTLQREFGARVDSLDRVRDVSQRAGEQIDHLFASLRDKAFKGNL